MRSFGRRFWARHLFRRTRNGLRPIHLEAMAPLFVRPGGSDLMVVHQIYFARSYQVNSPGAVARIDQRYREILESGSKPVIIDAGANIGVSTIWFAAGFPQARVVAVEPDPGNLALLRTNVAGRPNCVPVEAALGSRRGFAQLSNSPENLAWSIRTTRSSEGVQIITIDEALARSGGDELFIVKIDIEGFERDLFASNLQWLDRAYAIFVEPHDWMFPGERVSAGLQDAMAKRPFELFVNGDTLAYVRV